MEGAAGFAGRGGWGGFADLTHHPPSIFRHSRYRQTWFNALPRAIGGIAAACAVTYETIARAQAAAKKRGGRAAAQLQVGDLAA